MIPEYNNVKVITEGNIAYIVLNRPRKSNALNGAIMQDIVSAAIWCDDQDHVRVVILKGAGRAFSAGADLMSFSGFTPDSSWHDQRKTTMAGKKLIDTVANMKAITIAEIHGFAVGGALLLVLACDFRYAAQDSFFSIPEVDIGIPLAWGGIPRMVREFGPLLTKELVITCRRFSAPEALKWGMLNDIVPQKDLPDYCRNKAIEIAQKPYIPVQITKEHVNSVTDSIGDWGNQYSDAEALMAAMSTKEFAEIAMAYLQKLKEK